MGQPTPAGGHSFVVQVERAERPILVLDLASLERVSLASLAELGGHLEDLLERERSARRRFEPLARGRRLPGLTRGQSRVVALALAGLGNREIAASLGVSLRTVECHLTAAYRRLGIRSRGELAAAVTGEKFVVSTTMRAGTDRR